MLPPPMNKIYQTWDYMTDWIGHKFWNPNADPNLEEEEDIKGKIGIVTGSNAGIGKQVALHLAKRGAKIIMACRDLQKAQTAMESIKEKVHTADIIILKLDLADLQSIRDFVKQFVGRYDKLNILVNNAGFLNHNGVYLKTKDDFEYHMGVNHLGPFLLTRLLIDSLKKGAPSKIISVSSTNLIASPLDVNDLMMKNGIKTGDLGMEPYNVSKYANALCIRRLGSLLESDSGIRVFNVCPGFVQTEIFRSAYGVKAFFQNIIVRVAGIKPEMGCETIVYLATNKTVTEAENNGKGEMYRFTKYWRKGNHYLIPDDEETVKLFKMSENFVGL